MNFVKKSKPKKSEFYDTYWQFAVKRHEVFLKRLDNPIGPWTTDPILRNHRFTNAFRAVDRVSQYLIRLQSNESDNKAIFFKTLLFKIFNRIETYQFLENEIDFIDANHFDPTFYDELLTLRMSLKYKVYSAAYIMPSAGNVFGHKLKHSNHLALISQMLKDKLHDKLGDCKSMEQVYLLLLSYPSLGKFLAFQYTIDLNYSNIINFSEMDFVIAGPGAINGIRKCFSSLGDYSYEDVIKMMTDIQESECQHLGLITPNIFGRTLQLIDCQNLFCEVDKYLRGTNPEATKTGGQKRIKQKFTPNEKPISLFFPPKWNINQKLITQCLR